MPGMTEEQIEFVKSNFRSIWPVHLAGFTRLLVQLRERFDGDLDLMLVLAVIGDRTRPENWAPELLTYHKVIRDGSDDLRQYPINIQSISEYSGVPRETVRRKVAILQSKGWVAREANGRLAITGDAALDLADGTGGTVSYLASLLMAFESAQAIRAAEKAR